MTVSPISFSTGKELLAALLEDRRLTPQELDSVRLHLPEGQYLDYKDGRITHKNERATGRTIIREYVDGFANADGGVLVVGVSDEPREISPCQSPGKTTLDRWAESLLLNMAPLLVPPPRFQVVQHPKGPVLLIAVARAPQLVVEPESGQYFLRFHESTKAFPEHLLTDLLLGRRQQPILELIEVRPAAPFANMRPEANVVEVEFYLTLENAGLVAAEQVEIGIIAWTHGEAPPLNRNLLPHLAITEPGAGWRLRHAVATPRGAAAWHLSAFSRNSAMADGYKIFLQGVLHVSVAVYILAKSAAPTWFQVDFICWRSPHKASAADIFEAVKITRVVGKRPEIAIRHP